MAGVVHPPQLRTAITGTPGGVMVRGTPAGTSRSSDAIARAAGVYLASDEAAFGQGTVRDVDGARTSVAVIAGA